METWFIQNKETPECLGFRNEMPTNVREDLKDQLLKEQGFLCAYTGLQISIKNSHLEHIKPYSLCKDENDKYTQESYDYFNLLACFPKKSDDIRNLGDFLPKDLNFGAVFRQNKNQNFLSPLSPDCENRFKFNFDGTVKATDESDIDACSTIKTLGLDSEILTLLRGTAINNFLGLDSNPISEGEVEQLLTIIDAPNSDGELIGFCFAIKQVMRLYLYGS
jgi:uncharacterized protein (TIGR02646 family)